MDIRELVARRSDLGTFLVHLTRDTQEIAGAALKSIITSGLIEARSVFGHARTRLEGGPTPMSQHCVCFTETPLEYTHLLLADIEHRDMHFEPYGIAITKRIGRRRGVNPVWYLDITPGHSWLPATLITCSIGASLTASSRTRTSNGLSRTGSRWEHTAMRMAACGTGRSSGGNASGVTAGDTSPSPSGSSGSVPRSTSRDLKRLRPSLPARPGSSIRDGALSGSSRTSPASRPMTSKFSRGGRERPTGNAGS